MNVTFDLICKFNPKQQSDKSFWQNCLSCDELETIYMLTWYTLAWLTYDIQWYIMKSIEVIISVFIDITKMLAMAVTER